MLISTPSHPNKDPFFAVLQSLGLSETDVISQDTYFSDIFQVLWTFYEFYFKWIACNINKVKKFNSTLSKTPLLSNVLSDLCLRMQKSFVKNHYIKYSLYAWSFSTWKQLINNKNVLKVIDLENPAGTNIGLSAFGLRKTNGINISAFPWLCKMKCQGSSGSIWDVDGIAFVISHARVLDGHVWVFRVNETSAEGRYPVPPCLFSVQKPSS